jgi:predicted MPP superfamily phosphohydrolase
MMLCWWAAARPRAVDAQPRMHFLLTAGAYALLSLPVGVVVSPFGLVAMGYYGACLWLPLLLLGQAVRRVGSGEPWDGLLAVGALFAAGTGAHALLVEPNRLRVERSEIAIAAWPDDAEPLRIVQISDLQTVGACARERRAAEMINALQPDLIVFCGDFIAGPFDDPEPAIEAARTFLESLRAPLGVLCVAGHSESAELRARVLDGLRGVELLENEERVLDLPGRRSLRVFGLAPHGALLPVEWSERGAVTIAVSHVPDESRRLDGLGIDLHLAGHTHGGQIVIPGFGPPVTLSRLPRTYARGLHPIGDHRINVTPGIGMEGHHAPRIRLFCPPQIDFLVLKGSGAPTYGS